MRALFVALTLTLVPLSALAQPSAPPASPGQPPAARPLDRQGTADKGAPSLEAAGKEQDRTVRLDALFAALKAAPSDEAAKGIADRIDVALSPSGSDTTDLLMARAAMATQAKDYDLAIELLDGVLSVSPDHLDGWNKRATVFYLRQEYANSLNDLRQVVTREPRHYAAWAGIAIIAKEIGDNRHALEAARQALAIYPRFEQAKDIETELMITVEGRPI